MHSNSVLGHLEALSMRPLARQCYRETDPSQRNLCLLWQENSFDKRLASIALGPCPCLFLEKMNEHIIYVYMNVYVDINRYIYIYVYIYIYIYIYISVYIYIYMCIYIYIRHHMYIERKR